MVMMTLLLKTCNDMKTIVFNPGASLESCYKKLKTEAEHSGEVVCGEFNGTMMYSNESLENFMAIHFKSASNRMKDVTPTIEKFATENADVSVADFADGMGFWAKIERDKHGFATENCLDEMFANIPFLIYDSRDNDIEAVRQDDWRGDIDKHAYYTYWKPVPLPTTKSKELQTINNKPNGK